MYRREGICMWITIFYFYFGSVGTYLLEINADPQT